MKVLLERLDTKDTKNKYTLNIDEGTDLELGRGPLIRIDSTSISRKKALLTVKKDVLYIKCLKEPAVILDHDSTSGDQEKVAKWILRRSDIYKLYFIRPPPLKVIQGID
jgi:hypothetical protein